MYVGGFSSVVALQLHRNSWDLSCARHCRLRLILSFCVQHWWTGELGNRRGLFPATYVTPYHTS